MLRSFFKVLLLSSILFSVYSCTKSDAETAYEIQEKRIETYVNSLLNNEELDVRVEYNGGSTVVILSEGTGEKLSSSGTVTFDYAGYVFSGTSISASSLFATSAYDIAAESALDHSDPDAFAPVTESLKDGNLLKGLSDGLLGARKGEVRIILFSGKYGFGKKKLGTISANSALAYYVWIEDILN